MVAKVDGHADKVTQVVKKDRGGKGVLSVLVVVIAVVVACDHRDCGEGRV